MAEDRPASEDERLSAHQRLLACLSSEWSILERHLIALLSCLTGLSWATAGAILFSLESNAARLEIIKNVVIAQNYSDWHAVQVARLLSKVANLDRERRLQTEPCWHAVARRASMDKLYPDTDLPKRNADLTRLTEELSGVSRELKDLVGQLPAPKSPSPAMPPSPQSG